MAPGISCLQYRLSTHLGDEYQHEAEDECPYDGAQLHLIHPGKLAVLAKPGVLAARLDLCEVQAQVPAGRSTSDHSTAQHSTHGVSTAQHTWAQHCTAQHTRGQHSMWQHS